MGYVGIFSLKWGHFGIFDYWGMAIFGLISYYTLSKDKIL